MQTMKFVLKNSDDISALMGSLTDDGFKREAVKQAFLNVMDSVTNPNVVLSFLRKFWLTIKEESDEKIIEYFNILASRKDHEYFIFKTYSYSLDLTGLKKIRCMTTTKKSECIHTFQLRSNLAEFFLSNFVFNKNRFLVKEDNFLKPLRVFLNEDAIVSIFKGLGRKRPDMVYDEIDFNHEFFQNMSEVLKNLSFNARVNIADKFRKSTNFLKLIKILEI